MLWKTDFCLAAQGEHFSFFGRLERLKCRKWQADTAAAEQRGANVFERTNSVSSIATVGMCMDMCLGMCMDMCVDMCVDMCMDAPRHMWRHVFGRDETCV